MVCCMASSDSGSKGNHSSYQVVSKRVFEKDEWDESLLLIHLKQGCSLMLSKLTSYTKDQLPGGQYWNPAPEVEVLRKLAPSNDFLSFMKPDKILPSYIVWLPDYGPLKIPLFFIATLAAIQIQVTSSFFVIMQNKLHHLEA